MYLRLADRASRFVYCALTNQIDLMRSLESIQETAESAPFFPEFCARQIHLDISIEKLEGLKSSLQIHLDISIEKLEGLKSSPHFWNGAVREGMRHFHSPEAPVKKERLKKVITCLEKTALNDDGQIYWIFYARLSKKSNKAISYVNLGTKSHLGNMAFLSLCVLAKVETKKCMALLEGAVETILRAEKQSFSQGLPVGLGPDMFRKTVRVSAFYGDFIVGYILAVAGLRCQRTDWINLGERIFERQLNADPASLCEKSFSLAGGAAGISHLLWRYHQLTGSSKALSSSKKFLKYSDQIYQNHFLSYEKKFEGRATKLKRKATLLNSSMGLDLVSGTHHGEFLPHWDSMLALSNPLSQRIV